MVIFFNEIASNREWFACSTYRRWCSGWSIYHSCTTGSDFF